MKLRSVLSPTKQPVIVIDRTREYSSQARKDFDVVYITGAEEINIDGKWIKIADLDKPKRKPLEDGVLPLTESELSEFQSLFFPSHVTGEHDWIKVVRVYIVQNGFIFADLLSQSSAIRPIQPPEQSPVCIKNPKAIMWLARLIDLTGGK